MALSIPHLDSEDLLEDFMSTPPREAIETFSMLHGDIVILGIGGKIGVTLGLMIKKCLSTLGSVHKVYGVSRFSDIEARKKLERAGIITISCDLLDMKAVASLPDAEHVIFMAGRKFGTTANEHLTWAVNTIAPHNAAERYKASNLVVYSTGCVYPLLPPETGGAVEDMTPDPIGDYAQSALGRERIFQYYSQFFETRVAILRLNYSIDLRYGVLRDLADKIIHETMIEKPDSTFNCIWQGDVLNQTILSLQKTSSPAEIINITGPETISIRWAAEELGKRLGKKPVFNADPAVSNRTYLSNAAKAIQLFGYPKISLLTMMDMTADWVLKGGRSLGKPTHFETTDGRF